MRFHPAPVVAIVSAIFVAAYIDWSPSAHAADATSNGSITIHVDQPATRISPTVYGLMTEEINHAYDGGLYAELIQNRIFKDSPASTRPANRIGNASTEPSTMHWSPIGDAKISLDFDNPVNTVALTNSLKLEINSADATNRAGVANEGYWGIPVWPNTKYNASFYARASSDFSGPLTVDIESNDGKTIFATGTVPSITTDWQKYQIPLSTGQVDATADTRFVISAAGKGTVWFNLVSLFPPTYNNRPNGLRVDIMQKLADMHPAFLRFPGGNYLEGDTLDTYLNWKNTIGPLEDRPGHQCPWQYRSSDGLGLLEFFEWCEDLHMQPVLAVYAGYALNRTSVPQADFGKVVQDDMDELEYATGDQTTKWGQERAKDGHPDPFTVNYVEVGNEDNLGRGPQTYEWRFAAIFDAIKAKYPNIKVIATAHVKSRPADLFDDHAYPNPRAMLRMTHRYDTWPRTGTKIFFGEWATRDGSPIPTNNMTDTLADGAWLMGLERDSDVVNIASYAPLFVNVNPGGRQWHTNLIGYDALSSFGSPSYYMQKMYAENRGDVVLPLELDVNSAAPATRPATPGPVFAEATRDDASGDVILKVVNDGADPQPLELNLQGVGSVANYAKVQVLTGQPRDVNSIEEPTKVAPVEADITDAGTTFVHEFPPYSVTVMRLSAK